MTSEPTAIGRAASFTAATVKTMTTTTAMTTTTYATTTPTTPMTRTITTKTATTNNHSCWNDDVERAAIHTSTPVRTTITSDPGILCFHHCNVKVFCFTLPHICPNCKTKLDTTDDEADAVAVATRDAIDIADAHADDDDRHTNRIGEEDEDVDVNAIKWNSSTPRRRPDGNVVPIKKVLLPFRLPYPFIRASQYPCAIVLRPTTGDFLNDYNNATDLHIAVTTSTGTVVEFDRHGLRQRRTENMPEWWQCLLVGDVPEPWYDYWDDVLLQLCKQISRWSTSAYDEDTHNCYTFVLAFLQALAYDKLSEAAHSKTTFCEKYIVPRTTTAGKYISLYRRLRDTSDGIYVHPYVSKRQQQMHHRGRVRGGGYIKSSASTTTSPVPSTVKKTSKAMNSTTSSITTRSPSLCTIEE